MQITNIIIYLTLKSAFLQTLTKSRFYDIILSTTSKEEKVRSFVISLPSKWRPIKRRRAKERLKKFFFLSLRLCVEAGGKNDIKAAKASGYAAQIANVLLGMGRVDVAALCEEIKSNPPEFDKNNPLQVKLSEFDEDIFEDAAIVVNHHAHY